MRNVGLRKFTIAIIGVGVCVYLFQVILVPDRLELLSSESARIRDNLLCSGIRQCSIFKERCLLHSSLPSAKEQELNIHEEGHEKWVPTRPKGCDRVESTRVGAVVMKHDGFGTEYTNSQYQVLSVNTSLQQKITEAARWCHVPENQVRVVPATVLFPVREANGAMQHSAYPKVHAKNHMHGDHRTCMQVMY